MLLLWYRAYCLFVFVCLLIGTIGVDYGGSSASGNIEMDIGGSGC